MAETDLFGKFDFLMVMVINLVVLGRYHMFLVDDLLSEINTEIIAKLEAPA